MIRAAAVVVPAHEEAATIGRCVRAAAASLAACGLSAQRCHLVVVADACTDATAELSRVGAARAVGMRAALECTCGERPRSVWLATTDADSTVPRHWLAEHLRYADAGWDAVAGTVTVDDWSMRPPGLATAFAEAYSFSDREHPHVHGANLGVRASAYVDSGGFGALPHAEDHALVTALHLRGHSIRRPADLPVATSAREDARAPGGFADRLTALARARSE
ncbi:glycosyltransferase family 2 protein [Streptomonospora halophila]|uniref:4,4'-diaponeurosporenoate glycosyltransferase n=1 Tax=Streptomonospora halophila TaxID=427369 RepID=A0ABP9GXA6_9ACTN